VTAPRPFALLEALRPPPGYRTTWAVGTTYSLDLVAGAAVLGALDGVSRDEAEAPLTGTLRALRRLGDKTRIFAQQGCVCASVRMQPKLVGMFDAIIRRVPFPLEKRCFHPKVWVVRQEGHDGELRWVLVVSSKNISCEPSWEVGVALAGAPAKATNLPTLRAFVEHVAREGGDEAFATTAQQLDRVEWLVPRNVKTVRFAWHAGNGPACSNEDGHPNGMPTDAKRVLVISPFLDRGTVQRLGKHFKDAESAMLVSGRVDLDRALSDGMDALGPFKAYALDAGGYPMDGGDDDIPKPSNEENDDEARGLHAKIIATARTATDATVLVGSANMTGRAWKGDNCEAYVVLEGRADTIFDPLKAWADAVGVAEYRKAPASPPPGKGTLDRLHASISSVAFRLDETTPFACRLTADRRIDVGTDAELFVARPTLLGSEVRWLGEGSLLQACAVAERSSFVAMRLRAGTETKQWLQIVDVDPPIGQERDAAALRDLVAPERLPALLLSLLDDRFGDADGGEGDDDGGDPKSGGRRSGGRRGRADDSLSLETLLGFVERARRSDDSRGRELLEDAGRLVEDYRTRGDAAGSLTELFEAWDAIREEVLR
jgi:hypothetical protein